MSIVLMSSEIWRDIPTWEGFYQISNYGNARSLTRTIPASRGSGTRVMQGRPLKATVRKNGYKMIDCTAPGGRRESLYIHHLVLLVFEGPRPEWAKEIRHLDDMKTNCRLDNLVYGTPKQNADDRKLNNRMPDHSDAVRGIEHGMAKLTEEQVVWALQAKMSSYAAADVLGVNAVTVQKIRRRESWAHVRTPEEWDIL